MGLRILLLILACSSISTVFLTSGQLALDYHQNVGKVHTILENIEVSFKAPLEEAVWNFDEDAIEVQMDGLAKLPNIGYVELKTGAGESKIKSNKSVEEIKFPIEQIYSLTNDEASSESIGTLIVIADKTEVYRQLVNSFIYILIAHAVKSLIVSSFILIVIFRHVVSRIVRFNDYATETEHSHHSTANNDYLSEAGILQNESKYEDELTEMICSIERMKEKLVKNIEMQKQVSRLSGEAGSLLSHREENASIKPGHKPFKQLYLDRACRVFGMLSSDEYKTIQKLADQSGRSVWGQIWEESCAYRAGRISKVEA